MGLLLFCDTKIILFMIRVFKKKDAQAKLYSQSLGYLKGEGL